MVPLGSAGVGRMNLGIAATSEALPEFPKFKPLVLSFTNIGQAKWSKYQHAILTDVSGKGGVFEGADFSYAVLTRAYFHKARFVRCKFVGTRFVDCNFRTAEIIDCDFNYADFLGTRIDTAEILRNMPGEPNVRRELLQILRKNALSMGDVRSARAFVLSEIDAKKEHLRRAWKGDGKYYSNKYDTLGKKAKVGFQRIALQLDSFLWGHGERLWKMIFSVSALLIGSAAISTFSASLPLADPALSFMATQFGRSFVYYFNLFLDVPGEPLNPKIILLDWVIVVARYVAFGVLISGLFRWLSHR